MLIVDPDAFFQSNPPLTASAPLGALVFPPTPHADRTGRLTAAAPARPIASSMLRRDSARLIACPSLQGRWSGRNQRDLDRLLAAGDQVEALLALVERQLMCEDLVHGQRAGLAHLDRGGREVRAEVRAEHIDLLVVADDAPVDRRL